MLINTIKAFGNLMKVYEVDHYMGCATSAMRDAENPKTPKPHQVLKQQLYKLYLRIDKPFEIKWITNIKRVSNNKKNLETKRSSSQMKRCKMKVMKSFKTRGKISKMLMMKINRQTVRITNLRILKINRPKVIINLPMVIIINLQTVIIMNL